VAAVQLVGAVGQDHAHPLLPQAAGQEGGKRPRRTVGPVHVLEDQHERRGMAETVDQLEHRLEQPQLIGGARAPVLGPGPVLQPREDRRQLRAAAGAQAVQGRMLPADERPQGAQQRRVGKLGVGLLHAVPSQDQRRRDLVARRRCRGQPVLELSDEPGLADAGVTAEQHEGGPAGAGLPDGVLQLGQLADPTHEVTAGQSRPHDRSIA
jgi:hypothetical protein